MNRTLSIFTTFRSWGFALLRRRNPILFGKILLSFVSKLFNLLRFTFCYIIRYVNFKFHGGILPRYSTAKLRREKISKDLKEKFRQRIVIFTARKRKWTLKKSSLCSVASFFKHVLHPVVECKRTLY